jgi:hypothetical protein
MMNGQCRQQFIKKSCGQMDMKKKYGGVLKSMLL